MTHYSINNIPSNLMLNTNMRFLMPTDFPNNSWYQYTSLEDSLAGLSKIPNVNKEIDPMVTIEYSYRVRFWGNVKQFGIAKPDNRFAMLNETLSAPVSPRNITDVPSLEEGYASMPEDFIEPEVIQDDVYDDDDILELSSQQHLQEKEFN